MLEAHLVKSSDMRFICSIIMGLNWLRNINGIQMLSPPTVIRIFMCWSCHECRARHFSSGVFSHLRLKPFKFGINLLFSKLCYITYLFFLLCIVQIRILKQGQFPSWSLLGLVAIWVYFYTFFYLRRFKLLFWFIA